MWPHHRPLSFTAFRSWHLVVQDKIAYVTKVLDRQIKGRCIALHGNDWWFPDGSCVRYPQQKKTRTNFRIFSPQLEASRLQWFTVGGYDGWFLVREFCPYIYIYMYRCWDLRWRALIVSKIWLTPAAQDRDQNGFREGKNRKVGRRTWFAPAQVGNLYYNFWQDADHVKGIWRRCTLEDYQLLGSGEKELVTGDHGWHSFDCYYAADQRTLASLLCVLTNSCFYEGLHMYLYNGICRFYWIYYSFLNLLIAHSVRPSLFYI